MGSHAKPIVYATSWCPYCRMLVRDLNHFEVDYDYIDIEATPEAARIVESFNNGDRTVPTVVYPDGTADTNPDAASVMMRMQSLL